jgi:hypothetical protein
MKTFTESIFYFYAQTDAAKIRQQPANGEIGHLTTGTGK